MIGKEFVNMALTGIGKRRWAVAVLILMCVATTLGLIGCAYAATPTYPAGMVQEVNNNALRLNRYLELKKQGKTSPEQDQKMLEANAKAWNSLHNTMSQKEENDDGK